MRVVYQLIIFLLSLAIGYLNVLLYRPMPSLAEEQADIINQLNFLEKELKERQLGENMQALYPEGYVFVYALYGLSWAQVNLNSADNPALSKRALAEAIYAFRQVDSEKGRSTFSSHMEPPYGVYYQGWNNYLLAKILSSPMDFEQKEALSLLYFESCRQIAEAFRNSESPYLSSYPGLSWPADSFLAMASLQVHDQLYPPKYQQDIALWLQKVKARLDPENGMIAHRTDAQQGNTLQAPRGGSMTLMLRLLAEIDLQLAREQYEHFKAHFKSTALGLPMVREYPKGTFGMGDVDSGPVILGTGFAATIVSIGTYRVFGEEAMARAQFNTVHAFGLSQSSENSRSYLLGQLPMADAFIAWSRLAPKMVKASGDESPGLFIKFHFISIITILLIALPLYRKRIIQFFKARFS